MSELQLRRRILGLDFGRARIGVAVSDELGFLAHPVETIPAGSGAARRVSEIALEKNVERVVVGLPRHMNGSVGESAAEALAFANELRTLVRCEVITWDERLSTIAANRALRDSGRKTRHSRQFVDQVAAQMILQSYLDSLSAHKLPDLA
jgi:putative Holliday junction resolvase